MRHLTFKTYYKSTPQIKHSGQPWIQTILVKPNYKSLGELAFTFYGPKVWNSLPSDIKNIKNINTFKSNLKTFLFRRANE